MMRNYSFNHFRLKDDENGGNKIGMANVLGKKFVEECTSSCEYHIQESVKRHSKYIKDYSALVNGMKNATTELEYEEKNTC